jgi:hypothetical protein
MSARFRSAEAIASLWLSNGTDNLTGASGGNRLKRNVFVRWSNQP